MNRIAANPIPYWSAAGKTREVFDEAFRDFQEIGFTAVKADVPEGMSASAYADWIAGYGLSPSLSLFSSPFDETVDMAEEVERAKRFAATQVELGLDRTMISSMAVPARMAQPAVGAGFDAELLGADQRPPIPLDHELVSYRVLISRRACGRPALDSLARRLQTRRRLRGRQPLCGMGVTSLMAVT